MSDPFSINGGSIVALVGKDCIGVACDLRLGQQALTVSTDFPKLFPMGDKVFLGLTGLATDVQTLYSISSLLPSLPFVFLSDFVCGLDVSDDKGMSSSGSRRICIDYEKKGTLNQKLLPT
jgi:Proteasome subunit